MGEFWQYDDVDGQNPASEEETTDTWLSVSDLMSGLLLFFALLFITVMVKLKQYVDAFESLPLIIQTAIAEELGGEDTVNVDPETGDVSIDDRILFDQNSSELKPQGKEFLKGFIPVYSRVIFSDEFFSDKIVRIIIEGRTSSEGDEEYNLELSLERSLTVVEYIFSEEVTFPTKEQFKAKLLAAGRGEIDANQQFDDPSDRRVEFRFQIKRSDLNELLLEKNLDEVSGNGVDNDKLLKENL